MKTYFVDNNSNDIIVLFCGWGLDDKPFGCSVGDKTDVLFVYDYSTLDFSFDFSKYRKKYLIAFSYGVFISAFVQDKLPSFAKKIAINGTLKPIDKEFGISPKIFDLTLSGVSAEGMKRFYSKMFSNNLDYDYFLENLPDRTPENCKIELEKIKEYALSAGDLSFDFDKVLISDFDKIIPTKNQIAFWNRKDYYAVEGGHFPFYMFRSLDRIVSL